MKLVGFLNKIAVNPVESIINAGASMLAIYVAYMLSPLYIISDETVDGLLMDYGPFSVILKIMYVIPLIPWTYSLFAKDRLRKMHLVQLSALLMATTYMFVTLSRFILIGLIPTTWVWQMGIVVVLSICYLGMTRKIEIYKALRA